MIMKYTNLVPCHQNIYSFSTFFYNRNTSAQTIECTSTHIMKHYLEGSHTEKKCWLNYVS